MGAELSVICDVVSPLLVTHSVGRSVGGERKGGESGRGGRMWREKLQRQGGVGECGEKRSRGREGWEGVERKERVQWMGSLWEGMGGSGWGVDDKEW
ncbi:hypothetical protein Pmani_028527 [Petrolisthes manimaculis]|uniref:Uncharacterized protein n=1 Tax=Petrolisthes manimaculis TaxID=1843537 RepID=A0AAE1TXY7_9EUCA|nr:hypothetical protein Pmani_028527 [Petrolisthes manimaculis]